MKFADYAATSEETDLKQLLLGYRGATQLDLLNSGEFDPEVMGEIDEQIKAHAADNGLDLQDFSRPQDNDTALIARHALDINEPETVEAANRYRALQDAKIKEQYSHDPAEYESLLESAKIDFDAAAPPEKRDAARRSALNRGEIPFATFNNPDGTRRLELGAEVLGLAGDDTALAALFNANPNLDRNLIGEIRQKLTKPEGFTSTLAGIERQSDFTAGFEKSAAPQVAHQLKGLSDAIASGQVDNLDPYLEQADQVLAGTPLAEQFSPEERKNFIRDYATRNAPIKLDPEAPEKGLRTLSTGEIHVPVSIQMNKATFEKVLPKLPEGQREMAKAQREQTVSMLAKDAFKTITARRPEFADEYADQKAAGKTDAEILDTWTADPKNQSTAYEYLSGIAESIPSALITAGAAIPALAGNKASANVIRHFDTQTRQRKEFANLLGKDMGIDYDVATMIAPVVTDLFITKGAAAIARGTVGAAARSAIKPVVRGFFGATVQEGTKGLVNSFVKGAVKRDAAREGVEAVASSTLKPTEVLGAIGRDIEHGLTRAEFSTGMFASGFNRAAGASYVQTYSTLEGLKNPDGSRKFNDEQVRDMAVKHATTIGTMTGLTTLGFNAMGAAGLERIFDGGLTQKQLGGVFARLKKDWGNMAPAVREGIDMGNPDKMLASMMSKSLKPLWKVGVQGAKEEFPEEATQQFLEEIAIANTTGERFDVVKSLKSSLYAGMLGGVMGGGAVTVSDVVSSPEVDARREAAIRRSTLLKTAAKLDATAPQTAAAIRTLAAEGIPQAAKPDAAEAAVPEGVPAGGVQSPSGEQSVAGAPDQSDLTTNDNEQPAANPQSQVSVPAVPGDKLAADPASDADAAVRPAVGELVETESDAPTQPTPEQVSAHRDARRQEIVAEWGSRHTRSGLKPGTPAEVREELETITQDENDDIAAADQGEGDPGAEEAGTDSLGDAPVPEGLEAPTGESGGLGGAPEGVQPAAGTVPRNYRREIAAELDEETKQRRSEEKIIETAEDMPAVSAILESEEFIKELEAASDEMGVALGVREKLLGRALAQIKEANGIPLGVTISFDGETIAGTGKPVKPNTVILDSRTGNVVERVSDRKATAETAPANPAAAPQGTKSQPLDSTADASPRSEPAAVSSSPKVGDPITFTSSVPGTQTPTQGVIAAIDAKGKITAQVGKTKYPNARVVAQGQTEIHNAAAVLAAADIDPTPAERIVTDALTDSDVPEAALAETPGGRDALAEVVNGTAPEIITDGMPLGTMLGLGVVSENVKTLVAAEGGAPSSPAPSESEMELEFLNKNPAPKFLAPAMEQDPVALNALLGKRQAAQKVLRKKLWAQKKPVAEMSPQEYEAVQFAGREEFETVNSSRTTGGGSFYDATVGELTYHGESRNGGGNTLMLSSPGEAHPHFGQVAFMEMAVRSQAPISAEAVKENGLKVPEGYVRQGDLYVYQDPTQQSLDAVRQQLPASAPDTRFTPQNSPVAKDIAAHGDLADIRAWLTSVAKTGKPEHRELAKLLLKFPDVLVTPVHLQDAPFAGTWVPQTGQILINTARPGPRGGVDTVLHELVHAATHAAIKDPTPEQALVLKRIDGIRRNVAKRAAKAGRTDLAYGLGSNDEFFTHLLTSPAFQREVAAMTPQGERNWLHVLIDAVRDLLGLGKVPSGVLKDMIEFVEGATPIYGTSRMDALMQMPEDVRDTVRFAELTESLGDTPTQADIDSFKSEQPERYAELKAMRERVLRGAGYTEKVWKGWVPYTGGDTTNFRGEIITREPRVPITEIRRQSPFPTFVDGEPSLTGVAGFFSKDKSVAESFTRGISLSAQTDEFLVNPDRNLPLDAEGAFAGKLQFEAGDSRFRDAVRSGEYDSIWLNNTKDEGDVFILLKSENAKSAEPLSLDPATGQLIGPSQWGNSESPSILFQPSEDAPMEESVKAHRLESAKREILEDISAGTIPGSVNSFSELHDYVDANDYINDAEREDRMIGPLGKSLGWTGQDYTRFSSELVEDLDQWLKQRNPLTASHDAGIAALDNATDIEATRLREHHDLTTTGNVPMRQRALYRVEPDALARLVTYLKAAVAELGKALKASFNMTTAVHHDRLSRELAAAEDGYRVRSGVKAFDPDAPLFQLSSESDPAEFKVTNFTEVNQGNKLYKSTDSDEVKKGWWARMFTRRDDLRRPISALRVDRRANVAVIQHKVETAERLYNAAIKAENPNMDTVRRYVGSTAPLLTPQEENRLDDEYQAKLEEKTGISKPRIEAAQKSRDKALRNAKTDEEKDAAWATYEMEAADARNYEADALRDVEEWLKNAKASSMLARSRELRAQRDLAGEELARTSPMMFDAVSRLRNATDELQAKLARDYKDSHQDLSWIIDRSNGIYLVRSYKFHQDPMRAEKLLHDPEYAELRDRLVDFFGKHLADDEFATLKNNPAYEGEPDSALMAVARSNVKDIALTKFEDYVKGHEGAHTTGNFAEGVRVEIERFMKKKNLAPEITELLGEIDDPLYNAKNTLISVSNILFTHRMNKAIMEDGVRTGTLITEDQKNANTKYRNWQPLKSVSEHSQAYYPLGGLYASPEDKKAFDAAFNSRRNLDSDTAGEAMETLNKFILGASGKSMGIMILGNPGTYVRNVVGNSLIALSQGANPFSAKGHKSAVAAFNMVVGKGKGDEEFIEKMIAYRILGDGVNISYMREFMKQYREDPLGALDWAAAKGEDISPEAMEGLRKVGSKWGGMVDVLSRTSEFTETYIGPLIFLNELDALTKAGVPQLEAEQEAARITKMVTPGRTEVSQAVTGFSKHPISALIAPFIRFKSEMFRTVVNTWKIGLEHANSENPELRAHGYRRLAAAGIIQGGVTIALPLILQALSGISDEEDQLIRASMPSYAKNSSFWYRRTADGGLQTWDMTFTIPYSINYDAFTRAFKAAVKGRWEDVPPAFGRLISDEIVGEQIVAGTLLDLSRNKDEATGNEIWRSDEDFGSKLYKAAEHVALGGYTPAVLKKTWQAVQATDRPAKEDEPFFFTPVGIMTGMGMPVKPRDHDLPKLATRAFRTITEANRQAWLITNKLASPQGMAPGEATKLMQERTDAHIKNWTRAYKYAQAAKSMGMTTREVMNAMKEADMSQERSQLALQGYTNIKPLPAETMRKVKEIDPARYEEVMRAARQQASRIDLRD